MIQINHTFYSYFQEIVRDKYIFYYHVNPKRTENNKISECRN